MKTTNVFKFLSLAALAVALTITSCNRNRLDPNDDDEDLVQKNALAEDTYNDAQSIADQAVNDGNLANYKTSQTDDISSDCATITKDSINGTKNVTIDFGPVNCMCRDGKNRRGKLFVTFTGRYREAGTVITTTFQDYYVNDNKVEGTKVVTNMGANGAGHLVYHVVLTDGKITLANGEGVITWNADKYREWIAGENTKIWSDDEFLIWGTRNGTRANGQSYAVVVEQRTALRRIASCRWFVSGIAVITPDGKPTRTIDFGNGNCDDEATLTIGRRSKTIRLRR